MRCKDVQTDVHERRAVTLEVSAHTHSMEGQPGRMHTIYTTIRMLGSSTQRALRHVRKTAPPQVEYVFDLVHPNNGLVHPASTEQWRRIRWKRQPLCYSARSLCNDREKLWLCRAPFSPTLAARGDPLEKSVDGYERRARARSSATYGNPVPFRRSYA